MQDISDLAKLSLWELLQDYNREELFSNEELWKKKIAYNFPGSIVEVVAGGNYLQKYTKLLNDLALVDSLTEEYYSDDLGRITITLVPIKLPLVLKSLSSGYTALGTPNSVSFLSYNSQIQIIEVNKEGVASFTYIYQGYAEYRILQLLDQNYTVIRRLISKEIFNPEKLVNEGLVKII